MTFQKISEHYQEMALDQKISEFEYRKAITLTFFERKFSKKSLEKRRILFFQLQNADWDFSEGFLNGHHAKAAFETIREIGLSNEQTKSLMYAYWFSLPKERDSFKKHIMGGVVANRPELHQQRPVTAFQKETTATLGEQLYSAQNYLAWVNPLSLLAKEHKQIPSEQVVRVVENAQAETDKNGLTAGINTLVNGLTPFFFQKEENEILSRDPQRLSYQTIRSIAHKKDVLEPYLNDFAWLYLTQSKFDQGLELREFSRQFPERQMQMMLPLSFDRTRDE